MNKSLDRTTLTLGRQRIIYDDARFVGNVGWRQNEQTYDGLRSQIDGESIDIDLAYITQVNRIFGPDSPVGRFNGDILLANVSKSFGFGKLTGFAYGLELDEAAALSTNTIGVRLNGSRPASIRLRSRDKARPAPIRQISMRTTTCSKVVFASGD
jgi:hypothetical protein